MTLRTISAIKVHRSKTQQVVVGGVKQISLTVDKYIRFTPPHSDERDRWDRAVKSRDATIEELKRKVAELEAKVGRSTAPSYDGQNSGESKPVENSPVLNQNPSPDDVATPTQPALCEQPLDSAAKISQTPESVNQNPSEPDSRPRQAVGVPPGDPQPAQTVEEEKRYRWEYKYRQEALDYHCMIHGIPPLELHQVVGLPDPKHISPKMAIQRGYPTSSTATAASPANASRCGIRGR